jgi:thiol-disulfide isomerase/thioredoxin
MRRITNIAAIYISCLFITLFTAGVSNIVSAAENNSVPVAENVPGTISGKVSEIITAGGFTYIEVDAGKDKVWAAGPAVTTINKGDTIAFSTEMPMRNYHSKGMDRDFSIIYFVREFMTDKGPVEDVTHRIQSATQQNNKAATKKTIGRDEVRVGEYLREANLDGLNVETTKLSSYKGKPLIINLWASYCGPCRAEMGSLERLSRKYNGKLNIIGITIDDYRDRAQALIRETGITFANFQDHNLYMENMLGGNFIPLTVLVDEQGRILKKVDGVREWDDPGIIAAIEQVFRIKLSQ